MGFGFSVLFVFEGVGDGGPGLGRRGREASLRNPTVFQVGSGADRDSLGVGRMPVYQLALNLSARPDALNLPIGREREPASVVINDDGGVPRGL